MEIFGITPVAAILSHSAVTPLRAALVLVVAFVAAGFTLAAAQPSASRLGPGYDIEMSRMIPMRDGVTLEAWIFKPSQLKIKAPAVLELTQYGIDGGRHQDFITFIQRGYVFVQVEVRGRGRSGGEKSDTLGLQVGRDGYDAVEWIASQPWSDRHVFMYGGSFVGLTQWRTAAQIPPHLSGIAPYVPIYPGWDVPNTNGIPQAWTAVILGYTAGRTLNTEFIAGNYWQKKMLEHYAQQRSFRTLDESIGIAPDDWWMVDSRGKKLSLMKMWLDHVGDEAFNLAAEPKPTDFAKMDFPILTATGFFDDDQPGTLHYYSRYSEYASAKEVSDLLLIIEPWDHLGTQHPDKTIEGLPIPVNAVLDMNKLQADWYDWALGRGPRPELLRDRVTYYMMGANEWRYAHSLEGAVVWQELVALPERSAWQAEKSVWSRCPFYFTAGSGAAGHYRQRSTHAAGVGGSERACGRESAESVPCQGKGCPGFPVRAARAGYGSSGAYAPEPDRAIGCARFRSVGAGTDAQGGWLRGNAGARYPPRPIPRQFLQAGAAEARSGRHHSVQLLLAGMAHSGRRAAQARAHAAQFAELSEELQYWRPHRLRRPEGCARGAHQAVSRRQSLKRPLVAFGGRQ